MILFGGIKQRNKIPIIIFKNDDGEMIEVPIDAATADRITKYLSKIAKTEIEPSELSD